MLQQHIPPTLSTLNGKSNLVIHGSRMAFLALPMLVPLALPHLRLSPPATSCMGCGLAPGKQGSDTPSGSVSAGWDVGRDVLAFSNSMLRVRTRASNLRHCSIQEPTVGPIPIGLLSSKLSLPAHFFFLVFIFCHFPLDPGRPVQASYCLVSTRPNRNPCSPSNSQSGPREDLGRVVPLVVTLPFLFLLLGHPPLRFHTSVPMPLGLRPA